MKTSECIEKIEIIKNILYQKKIPKYEIDRRITERKFDDLNTSIQLMKKMNIADLYSMACSSDDLLHSSVISDKSSKK